MIKSPTVTATYDGSPKEGHTEDDAAASQDGNQEDNKEGNAEWTIQSEKDFEDLGRAKRIKGGD